MVRAIGAGFLPRVNSPRSSMNVLCLRKRKRVRCESCDRIASDSDMSGVEDGDAEPLVSRKGFEAEERPKSISVAASCPGHAPCSTRVGHA